MKTMKTWKDYADDAGIAVTTWNYDVARGFLSSKVYDDLSSVTYSNSAGGRLLSRTWARGIVTSYDYNNAGDLGTITYSDSTPAVAFTQGFLALRRESNRESYWLAECTCERRDSSRSMDHKKGTSA